VRELDIEHRQRQQQGGQVSNAHTEDASGEQPGKEDRAQVRQRRKGSPDSVHRVITGPARPLGDQAGQRQRQLSVGVAILPVGVRIHTRARGIEVVADRCGDADLAGNDRQESLVRMLVAVGIPRLESMHAECGRHQQDERQHDELPLVGATRVCGPW
jgi:hypothetical protein